MSWWVYKCNAKNLSHQRHWGDWNNLFSKDEKRSWGVVEIVPQLDELNVGDMILAYQTDRNELVGIAQVVDKDEDEDDGRVHVYMKPVRRIGAKVLEMKKRDERVAGIWAFNTREVKTLYHITADDAEYMIDVASRVRAS